MKDFNKAIQEITAAITALEIIRAQLKTQKPEGAAGQYVEYIGVVLSDAITREEDKRAELIAAKLKEIAAGKGAEDD